MTVRAVVRASEVCECRKGYTMFLRSGCEFACARISTTSYLMDLSVAVLPIVSSLVYVLLFGSGGWFGAWQD